MLREAQRAWSPRWSAAAAAPTGVQAFAAERESPAELGARPNSAAGPPSANHPNLQEPQRPTFQPGSHSVTPMGDTRSDSQPLHPAFDSDLAAWLTSLEELSSSEFTIRQATADSEDARWMRYLQIACEPITVQSEPNNDETIAEQRVLFAMSRETPIGFCVSMTGTTELDPVFIQIVGVVGAARGRGIGTALMHAVADQTRRRTIAFATQDENLAARRMNERFAASIDAELRRVNLGTHKDEDLGIRRGLGYRSWTAERSHPTADSATTERE